MLDLTESARSVTFSLRVVPRASKSEVVGVVEGALKVRISAPPVDGAANEEVIRLLSKAFDVPRSRITIVAGLTSKTKRIRIAGTTPERLRELAGG